MKQILLEDLKRIHEITYGKQIMEDQDFLDNLLKVILPKIDDPKKSDLVSSNVDDFFNTLESSSEQGGISQQQRGSQTFQKEVESMQIGLKLLGYDLPKYGVDGLFGPETAEAVTKFIKDNLGDSKQVNEDVKLVSQGGGLIGRPGQGTHSASGWANNNAWDVKAPVGADVYSVTDGVVSSIRKGTGSDVVKSGVKKIYGDQVSIKSNDGNPDVFYTHIDSTLSAGDKVNVGDVIGTIMQGGGITPHVHIGLSSGNLSDLVTGMSNAGGGSESTMVKATPEMLDKMIDLLKQKGVDSEDLSELIDKRALGGAVTVSLAGDWLNISKDLIKKWESFTDKPSWDENKYRGGYGSSKKLENGRLVDVTKNTTWTQEEAEKTLEHELKNFYAPTIANQLGMSNWNKLNDKQKASLVSLGYNAGPYFITAREYGKNIKNAIENDDMELAASYIQRGPTTGAVSGKNYSGLERRRKEESQIFLA
jgi:GH24 family phage-related lysozyme (muramidase)